MKISFRRDQNEAEGYSIAELLVSLSIVSLLSTAAIGSLSKPSQMAQAGSTATTLFLALQQARESARLNSQSYQLCGSDDGFSCSREWSKQLILFSDSNQNHIAEEDEIEQIFPIRSQQLVIQTRVGFGRTYASYTAEGYVNLTGSFLICSLEEEKRPLKKVTWNGLGRPYLLETEEKIAQHSSMQCF